MADECGLSIHVVNSATKNAVKRQKESTHPAQTKKRKKAKTPSKKPPSKLPEPKESQASRTQSYRHLFSFGGGSGELGETSSTRKTEIIDQEEKSAGSFSFLHALSHENNELSEPSMDSDGDEVIDDPLLRGELEGSNTAIDQEDLTFEKIYENQYSNTSPENRHDHVVKHPRRESKDHMDIDEGDALEPKPFIYIDPFDMSAVSEIASRFCRQKPVEELEEEWDNGFRNEMRQNFKVKRQAALRGRKLNARDRVT